MKRNVPVTFAAIPLLIAVAIPVLIAQEKSLSSQQQIHHTRYRLVDLGTFGGPQSYVSIPDLSYARVLNNRGVVAGWADTPTPDPFPDFCWMEDCFVTHAFRSQNGTKQDLARTSGRREQSHCLDH